MVLAYLVVVFGDDDDFPVAYTSLASCVVLDVALLVGRCGDGDVGLLIIVVIVFLDNDLFWLEVGVAQGQGDHKLTSTGQVAGGDGAMMQFDERP